jgi:hypothetical protein
MPTCHLSSTKEPSKVASVSPGGTHEITIHPFIEICKSSHTLSISKRLVLSSSTSEPILIHGDPFFHFLPRVCAYASVKRLS